MQLGMVGLGRMGANLVRRLMAGGHEIVVFDLDPERVGNLADSGAIGAESLEDLVRRLEAPRVVWIMLPCGAPTESTLATLATHVERGDVLIDGGNSHYKDDVRRARELAGLGIHYVDVGTSGGVWGLERGYCLMIGAEPGVAARLDPIFKTLAPGRGLLERTRGRELRSGTAEEGYLLCGPPGAGHFVKMIHNGIEYGLMQAYAEGFDLLRGAASPERPEAHRFELDLPDVAEVWRRGSVITSWLLDLLAAALAESPALEGYSGVVQDSGEGRWTVEAALDSAVAADVLTTALYARFRSRPEHGFAEKVLSA
ncbi:MAG: phosphogluconate dehydrogenase (NAD(+)-dependent, decarboxylating), partial [Myxococcota bacterium]